MRVLLNKDSLDWLMEKRLFLNYPGQNRLKSGLTVIQFHDNCEVEPYVGFYGGGLSLCRMGSFSFSNSAIQDLSLQVGRYCSLSFGLTVAKMRHPLEYVTTAHFTYHGNSNDVAYAIADFAKDYDTFYKNPQKAAPVIEDDVWIGQGVFLNRGVRIGRGAVVAAQSVVTRNVLPYSIVGGNPAQLIRMRFAPEIIEGLEATEWWKYKFTDLRPCRLDDPGQFIEQFLKLRDDLQMFSPERARMRDMPGKIL